MTDNVDEERILAIWRTVLGNSALGPEDSFIALGGTSIAAFRIMSRLKEAYGNAVSLRTLFDNPTPRALAAVVSPVPAQKG